MRTGPPENTRRRRPTPFGPQQSNTYHCSLHKERLLPCTDMSDSSAKSARFGADVIIVGAGLAGLVAACELVDRGLRVLILDQENSANLGGQAFWSFGGLFFVDSPEQRRLGHPRQSRTRPAGLAGDGGLRSARGLLAAAMGVRLRRFRGRGETQLAARPGAEDLSVGGLGRARWLWRSRAWQLGAPVSHHLGYRARLGRDLRASSSGTARRSALRPPSPGRRVDRGGWRGDGRARHRTGAVDRAARCGFVAKGGGPFDFRASAVIVTSGGIGGDHDLVRKNWP